MYMRAYSFGVVFLLTQISVWAVDTGEEQAKSLIRGLAANWAGLETYDVLIDNQTFSLSPDGNARELSLRYRLLADMQANRYLFVSRTTWEESLTGSKKAYPKTHEIRVFFYDEKSDKAIGRSYPGYGLIRHQKVPMGSRRVLKNLSTSLFPDVRLVGYRESPRSFFSRYTVDEAIDSDINAGEREFYSMSNSSGTSVVIKQLIGDDTLLTRSYLFDLTTLVPVNMSQMFSHADGSGKNYKCKERVTWSEKEGIFLPSELHGERMMKWRKDGVKKSFPEHYDINFRWLSVNETIDPQMLNSQLVNDSEKLLKMLAPSSKAE